MESSKVRNEDRFAVRNDLSAEEIDGELVLFDLERDAYFSLNEVAGIVWRGAREGETFGTIVESIAETYEIDTERARRDAVAFLEEALEHDLIERIDGANSD
jgi:hypothetical protein